MFVVKYTGKFAFIKPWTAVRDEEVYSQQFLTPSIIGGIERKLFPELLNEKWGIYKIKGHRLSYSQISQQQEQTQARGWNSKGKKGNKIHERPYSILTRGVLIDPVLLLAFDTYSDAEVAMRQHVCLARNEDLLYPVSIIETSSEQFIEDEERYGGFELVFERTENSFLVGYNRLNENQPMYGWLRIVGNPVKNVF